ncbi:hypothetical protein K439DRAFT_1611893 [Ramaria rubella]|nr:hypothetical protein K439DRAFT_1611893 [Ramaria rubella]
MCIMDDNEIVLLVQEDKRLVSPKDPQPQVIAGAVAAFRENNRLRDDLGLPALSPMIIPAITMRGTFPTFYKIPVTHDLARAVAQGQYPLERTTVYRYKPMLPRRNSEGMRPLSNRVELVKCFGAFKQFILCMPEDHQGQGDAV